MKEKVGFFSLDVVCTERSIVSWMKTVLIFNRSIFKIKKIIELYRIISFHLSFAIGLVF